MSPSSAGTAPFGTHDISGIVHRPSPLSVADTVEHLARAIDRAGATLFAIIDHSGEAERAGLSLRTTKLLIFGNPASGTPVMDVAPTAALDLPLKILVWAADDGEIWMSYLAAGWLADRHDIQPEMARPLWAVDTLASAVASS